jgi:hypothetical protein
MGVQQLNVAFALHRPDGFVQLVRNVANACHAAVPEIASRSGTDATRKAPPQT